MYRCCKKFLKKTSIQPTYISQNVFEAFVSEKLTGKMENDAKKWNFKELKNISYMCSQPKENKLLGSIFLLLVLEKSTTPTLFRAIRGNLLDNNKKPLNSSVTDNPL